MAGVITALEKQVGVPTRVKPLPFWAFEKSYDKITDQDADHVDQHIFGGTDARGNEELVYLIWDGVEKRNETTYSIEGGASKAKTTFARMIDQEGKDKIDEDMRTFTNNENTTDAVINFRHAW